MLAYFNFFYTSNLMYHNIGQEATSFKTFRLHWFLKFAMLLLCRCHLMDSPLNWRLVEKVDTNTLKAQKNVHAQSLRWWMHSFYPSTLCTCSMYASDPVVIWNWLINHAVKVCALWTSTRTHSMNASGPVRLYIENVMAFVFLKYSFKTCCPLLMEFKSMSRWANAV